MVLAGETFAFADCFDAGYAIKHDLQSVFNDHVPLTILTDSENFSRDTVKSTVTTENRLIIDTETSREAHDR